ncbi:MAG: transglutaminase family protein [Pirellulaceae bacterium]
MTIRVALRHHTSYFYDRHISLGPQLVRLKPAYHGRTEISAYDFKIEPKDHFLNWQQDPFANPVARLVFPKPTNKFVIKVDLIAEMTVINPFDFFVDDSASGWPFKYDDESKVQLAPYLAADPITPKLERWIKTLPTEREKVIDFLVDVNRAAQQQVDYTVRLEPGVQTPEETLTLGSGSCRDSAWMLVQAFRHIGMAARFVSGYLIQLAPDQKPVEGPEGPTEDFCDLHAWTEVYLPGAGWVGLDPTSGLMAGEGHIPLACTPSYTGAAPITGGHEKCEVTFEHEMSVARIQSETRVSKPFTDKQWAGVMRVGKQVDEMLDKQDVRLTMGGEPTFVAIDNADDPQWNTDAVGEEKRVRSNQLLMRLREKYGFGAMLHYGQGKWYPGESLPRWALTCLWRRDGQPIWQNPKLIADEGVDYGHSHVEAKRFTKHLADQLGVDVKCSFPVYEDTFHYLWREQRLPIDTEPTKAQLDDPNEREMMVRTFTRGLGQPVGYVMPLRRAWWQSKAVWQSSRWPVRSQKIFLVPGNSPVGLRLPLDTLPGKAINPITESSYIDPFSTRPLLPATRVIMPDRHAVDGDVDADSELVGKDVLREKLQLAASEHEAQLEKELKTLKREDTVEEEDDDFGKPETSDGEVIPTALCVEARYGRLYIFLPPTQRIEDYLDLINAIEQTCSELNLPVILEGYLPPTDERLEYFKITPDPGVIEVNVQPSGTWDQLVELVETMYHEAQYCRLGADKFDLDGLHTGTGGGAHIVMGGATPADSPFVRRPDVLGSMVRFWHNHPAMSYLFSGKFIGPTSQAPRMDEARPDAVYEMEIALQQLGKLTPQEPPWMVDRLFRDLLVDLTGNTHRAEICIDKLYSPDSATGRLGLLELRAFEMPPHAHMNLVQQLLIRSIIAAFWKAPSQQSLTRWGTRLYDRYLLPHFVWQDLVNLLSDIRDRGIDLDPNWFVPQFNFRFAKIGELTRDGVRMELRSAIEPWYLMGEEPSGGGTARYVDASMERLQVSVEGFDPHRHAILCQGRQVPMHTTDVAGEFVAGVKYRAWQPPRCLHPTIAVDTPLQFDIVDRNRRHSVGGCRYHVSHPAGLTYDKLPINASEAETRRATRFVAGTVTGGIVDVPALSPTTGPNEYPVTFDLRRNS